MTELTKAQKNKLLAAAEIVENGEMAVLKKILEFEDTLEEGKGKIDSTLTEAKEEISTLGKELNEKVEAKLSEVQSGKDGKDGENYVLTDQDKKDIASSITVPIIEKEIETIIEKTEVIRETPIVTENVVEKALYEEPNQIIDKINKGTNLIDNNRVKGLSDLEKLVKLNAFNPTMGPSFADIKSLSDRITALGTGGTSSPLTTKGDVYTYSTTNDRLPVGSNGQVLSSDSSTSTGLKWITLGGGGDMVQSTYDPAGIGEQLVGLTATQTLTNKTLTSAKITTNLSPTSNDGAALGGTTLQFSDLFLAEGGVINWDNGDATMTQTANDITIAGITTFGVGTSTAVTLGTIELGAASDTTLARVSAGVVSIEGVTILTTATGQPLDATLTALAAYNTNGLLTQTAADTFTGRIITGTTAQITVSNGDGVAGNPTLSLPADVLIPTVLTVPNTGLHLLDTDASHDLIIKPGSDISADRTLTITTGNTDMIINVTAVTDGFVLTYDTGTSSWRGEAASGGGASTALDNLASVAINTTLVSDTDNTDALGTAAISWSDLFLGDGSVITWSTAPSTADITLTHTSNTLTLAGGNLVSTLGATTLAGTVSGGGQQLNNIIIGTSTPLAGTFTTLIITSFGGNWTNAGRTVADLGTITTADINGGTLDGTVIGGASAAAATVTTLGAGAITSTGLLSVTLGGNTADLKNTTDNASVQIAILEGDRATMAANDEAYVSLKLSDSAGNQDEMARITWKATTVTSTSEVSRLQFGVVTGGTLADELYLTSTALSPAADGGNSLGTTALGWQNLFGNTGFVFNLENGDWVATHTAGILTVGTGDLRVTTAGTNTASAVTVGGTQTLTSKTIQAGIIDYVIEPASDDTFEGEVTNDLNAGYTTTQWDLVYLASADSRWELADADAAATSGQVLLALAAVGSITDGNALNVVLRGIVRNDGWTWTTVGAPLYVSTTAGAMTETQPSGADDVIRIVGYVLSDDCIYFNPENDWITHT